MKDGDKLIVMLLQGQMIMKASRIYQYQDRAFFIAGDNLDSLLYDYRNLPSKPANTAWGFWMGEGNN